jgi:large subunit ribosomal protein L31
VKQDVHPPYGPVLFRDRSSGETLLTGSTIVGRLGVDHPRHAWQDDESYPVVDVDVTTASHPCWTGKGRVVDSEGRTQKFNRRCGGSR